MAKSELKDWGRANYKRSDLGELVRWKYAKRIRESTIVVVLDPKVAKAFLNDGTVNQDASEINSPNRGYSQGKKK